MFLINVSVVGICSPPAVGKKAEKNISQIFPDKNLSHLYPETLSPILWIIHSTNCK